MLRASSALGVANHESTWYLGSSSRHSSRASVSISTNAEMEKWLNVVGLVTPDT